jgi:hypothetical protein
MSQGPVPPRYPPQFPQQPQPQIPQPWPPQPGAAPASDPQTQQDGYLVAAPGEAPAYPQAGQPLNYLTPGAPAGGIWTYGSILVMHKQAELPPQCIKCGAPADGQPLKRKLSWHSSWVYALILVNLIIYIIVAAVISQRATILVGVCAKHRARRRTHMLIAWLLFFGSIVAFVVAGNLGRGNNDLVGGLIIGGVVLVLASLIWAVVVGQMIVTPYKIDPQYVWLKGVGPEYLAQFPPMPGGPQVY